MAMRSFCFAAGLFVAGCVLAAFATVNLFGTFTPVADKNADIDARLHASVNLPDSSKLAELQELMRRQERALASGPSEPYGWERLSYLRWVLGRSGKDSFAALRMSDLVSPGEPQQLPERALTWMKFANVESAEQRDYQDELWQKAFIVSEDATWDLALRQNIARDVGDAIARKDQALGESWRAKMRDAQLN